MKFPEDSPGIDEILNSEAQKEDQEEKGSPDKEAAQNELNIDSPAKRQKAIKINDEEKEESKEENKYEEESPLYLEQQFPLKRSNSNISSPGETRE